MFAPVAPQQLVFLFMQPSVYLFTLRESPYVFIWQRLFFLERARALSRHICGRNYHRRNHKSRRGVMIIVAFIMKTHQRASSAREIYERQNIETPNRICLRKINKIRSERVLCVAKSLLALSSAQPNKRLFIVSWACFARQKCKLMVYCLSSAECSKQISRQ